MSAFLKFSVMKRNSILLAISGVILVSIMALVIFTFTRNNSSDAPPPDGFEIGFGSDTVKARVLDITEEGFITLGEHEQKYQYLLVKLLEGPLEGQLVEIDYGRRQIRPPGLDLKPGDSILVTATLIGEGQINAYFTDYIRTTPLLWLLGTFILFSVLVSGWKGVRSLIGMGFSLFVIMAYIIPQILQGKDPVFTSIIGAFVLLSVTLYLTYGWTLKTHAAVIGTLFSLVITGMLAAFFVQFTRLTGFGSEEALFLFQQAQVQINLRGLVLGGMLIGALGVLDDLVITQASAVMELYISNPEQGLWTLFRSAMRIGQDHVAATINTLVLAYSGAALPTILLFSLSGENYSYLINLEFVTEEIVRTLVGSLGLIAAVPLTTILSSIFAYHYRNLDPWARYLGPLTSGHDSNHHH